MATSSLYGRRPSDTEMAEMVQVVRGLRLDREREELQSVKDGTYVPPEAEDPEVARAFLEKERYYESLHKTKAQREADHSKALEACEDVYLAYAMCHREKGIMGSCNGEQAQWMACYRKERGFLVTSWQAILDGNGGKTNYFGAFR